MKRIALTISYPSPPSDEKDQWRLEKYSAVVRNAGMEIELLFLDEWAANARHAARSFDGVALAGGADLPTDWYGETPLEGAGLDLVSDVRPKFEREICDEFLALDKPVLGICYGAQFLNVYRGGALIQDIDLQLPNRAPQLEHADGNIHSVRLDRNSKLFQIIGEEEFEVPSFHHQAISRPAPDALISAVAPDGVLEAVEWSGPEWMLGVQWHPERAPESNATQRLFEAFRAACK